MTRAQMQEYDRFLDENDWDIYYWATQTPAATTVESAEGAPEGGHAPGVLQGEKANRVEKQKTGEEKMVAEEMRGARTKAGGEGGPVKARPSLTDAPEKVESGAEKVEFGGGPVGEWSQTVGRNREPYRPPPKRWVNSEILRLIKKHVAEGKAKVAGTEKLGGLGSMPALD